jgi:hypothetical protein
MDSNAMLPRKDVLPTFSASRFMFSKSLPVGANPFVLVYSSIKLFLNSLDVCKASKEASPAEEYTATAVRLALSPNLANCPVCLAMFARADDLADRSAIDDI